MSRFLRTVAALNAGLLIPLAIASCASAPADPAAIADEYALQIGGEPSVTQVEVADDLSAPPWGPIETACADVGYDLAPYAGSTLTMASYPLEDSWEGMPLTLHLLRDDDVVVGAYVAIRAENLVDQPVPGVLSLNDVHPR